MAVEIERKFLVCGDFKTDSCNSQRIVQGYICSEKERTVRVRIRGDKGFLTIKGISNEKGTTRFEFEKEITLEEAEELLKLCEPGIIDKTRFLVPHNSKMWEVDEFYGDNAGLVMAEIELNSENEKFDKPEWLGEEVTGDKRYYNSMLTHNPYKNWKQINN